MNTSVNRLNAAFAVIKGAGDHSQLHGYAEFEQRQRGILVTAEIFGLPEGGECNSGIFALHIHDGISCETDMDGEFTSVGTHYNPDGCPHPYHAGDLPPLFSNGGYAYMSVITDRFTLGEIIGKVIVIHENSDDFTLQPAGGAGNKIACGKILRE